MQVNISRHRVSPRGLALMEILVIIAAILLMMSILLPALRHVREAARRGSCRGNLKQQGSAMHTYALDWQGAFPPAAGAKRNQTEWPEGGLTVDETAVPTAPAGQGLLYVEDHLTDANTFYCPSNRYGSKWWEGRDRWQPGNWNATYVQYPYWASYKSAFDTANLLDTVVALDMADKTGKILMSDLITVDLGSEVAPHVSRNHIGKYTEPSGGNVTLNDQSVHWRSFNDTQLQLMHEPGNSFFERHFYF